MVKFGVKVSLIEPGRYGGATSAASPEMVDIFTVYRHILILCLLVCLLDGV
jgi:hypothetical protein